MKSKAPRKLLRARSKKRPAKRSETRDWKPKAIEIRSKATPKRRSERSKRCSVSKRARFALRGYLPTGTSRRHVQLLLSECLLVEPFFSARRHGVRASPRIRTSRPSRASWTPAGVAPLGGLHPIADAGRYAYPDPGPLPL